MAGWLALTRLRYQYSVCPAGTAVTEACFNQHVLPFVGANTTIRYLDGLWCVFLLVAFGNVVKL